MQAPTQKHTPELNYATNGAEIIPETEDNELVYSGAILEESLQLE